MSPKADIGCKRLISLDPAGWIRWVTANPRLEFGEMLDSEFGWISRHGDVLIRVTDPNGDSEFLIATELQLRYSPAMPRRMRAYAALAEEKFKLPVYPVLIVILPAPDAIVTAYHSTFQGILAHQDYRVIQLSDVEASSVLSAPIPTLLPFVPVMKGGDSEPIIRLALQQLQYSSALSELEPLLAFFARFVLDSEVVTQIMRWDMAVLRESPWYEEIKQEGIQIGEQRGKQEAVPILAELGLSADDIARRLALPLELVEHILRSA